MFGKPSSFLVVPMRCGARMTHPLVPVQCAGSRPASFSDTNGSPPLPKIDSTKSRLLTILPGAKKRTSIVCCLVKPSTSGTTTGRSRRETHDFAGASSFAKNGNVVSASGAVVSAFLSKRAAASLGTAFLSLGMGRPPSATWKTPLVVRRSLFGLCNTPCSMR